MSATSVAVMNRRDFGVRMVALGAGSVLFAAAPLYSSSALAEVLQKWGRIPPIDMGFDGALENQPGYSAVIPVNPAYCLVDTASTLHDAQLC